MRYSDEGRVKRHREMERNRHSRRQKAWCVGRESERSLGKRKTEKDKTVKALGEE